MYFKLGRENQAIDLLQQAYDKFPDPEVAAHLGAAYINPLLLSHGVQKSARHEHPKYILCVRLRLRAKR